MSGERWLVMMEGPQQGQTFVLDQVQTIIGRDPSSSIPISDPQVSRQHARITQQGNLMVIEDLGSTNGTFANGARLTRAHTLSNGDAIALGNAVTLTYNEALPIAAGGVGATARPGSTAPAGMAAPPPVQPVQQPPLVVAPPAGQPIQPPPFAPAPPPLPVFPPADQAPYAPSPPPLPADAQAVEEQGGRKWLWVGCGCLVLLIVFACLAVVVLDQLAMLPDLFYEPLRWLGLDTFFQ